MSQAIHILVKDARYLWCELCLFIGLAALFAWKAGEHFLWVEILLAVTGIYLIVRVVHAEAIPGNTQFWITRPYRWQSLLSAKILFILLFINLPILVARIVLIYRYDFPLWHEIIPLVWSQFLIIIGVCLPAAALAAVTADILPFIFSSLILLVAGFLLGTPIGPGFESWTEGFEWVRNSVVVAPIVLAGIFALHLQYKKRQTGLSRILALGMVIMAILAYTMMPATAAMDIQTRLSPRPPFEARVTIEQAPRKFAIPKSDLAQLSLPLAVTGIPADTEVKVDALTVTLEGLDGRKFKGLSRPSQAANTSQLPVDAVVFVGRSFFDAENDQPVRLAGSLYLTVFGDAQSQTATLSARPVSIGNGLMCHLDQVTGRIQCCSAFRWPRLLLYVKVRDETQSVWPLISYSPFPAGMELNYIEDHGASGPPPHAPQATFSVRAPLSHVRIDFGVEQFNMKDFVQADSHRLKQ